MDAYAVIETGGKQYMVREGDSLTVELLDAEVGSKISLDTVLAVSDGEKIVVGTPIVDGAAVSAEVLDHVKGRKVVSFKKKRRKGYSRKIGHRQEHTVLKVLSVSN
jgi:large subunit ribosomal protein L21